MSFSDYARAFLRQNPAALDAGLEVTVIHNHFLGDTPRVMFMHLGGHGPSQLDKANSVKRELSELEKRHTPRLGKVAETSPTKR
jgi:hypothetical protein